MRSLKFAEFYKGQFTDDGYELYIVKDDDKRALYIGISRDSIWHRWFGRGPSHMDTDSNGKIYGKSPIGEEIEHRLPSSWEWTIEMWTKADCLRACEAEFSGRDTNEIEIESLEPYMIMKFQPLYNVAHSVGRDESRLAVAKLPDEVNQVLNPTIAQAEIMFLESIQHPRSVNTLQTYRKALETFSNILAIQQIDRLTFPVAELTEDAVTYFVEYMKDFSPATENLYLQVLKNFFEFLEARQLATINSSRVRALIRRRSRRLRDQPAQYPEEEIKYLIEFMSNLQNLPSVYGNETDTSGLRDTRDRAVILTLADTGLRVDEISKLRCSNIDWERSRAMLKGRGSKQVTVRFSARALNALRDYLLLREPLDVNSGQPRASLPLFARHDKGAGKKIKAITTTTIRRIVAERVHQSLGARAVGRITPHTFLHYFVTTILRATGNLKLAQVLARHASIQITQKFAHISDEELDQAYCEVFEKRIKEG